MYDLIGKRALVTGSSRGIGKAIAIRLARDGCKVCVNYVSRQDSADSVVAAIMKAGGSAFTAQADVAVPGESVRLVELAHERMGGLDIFVSNAGTGLGTGMLDTTEEGYDYLSAITRGAFFSLQRAGQLISDFGRIVTISSVATLQVDRMPVYAASKLAIEQYTRCLAHEIGARGVTVNAVLPGGTDTDLFTTLGPQARIAAANHAALKRLGQPEDIADIVAFLVSDQGRWITAECIEASGGHSYGFNPAAAPEAPK